MVTQEQFEESKKIIKAGWPSDKVVKEEETRLFLQCENGAYLVFTRFELPPELEGTPAAAMFKDKIMFQFTEDLNADTFENILMELAGKREAEGRVKEAIDELGMRIKLGSVLY